MLSRFIRLLYSNCFSFSDLCVETHDNVSILYADVVNFSGLTVTLPIRKLVETLNDLFGSFDEASERHNVLRIKFLGDCYYCVSGVPTPNSQHAKSCVDLGKIDGVYLRIHLAKCAISKSRTNIGRKLFCTFYICKIMCLFPNQKIGKAAICESNFIEKFMLIAHKSRATLF